MEYQRVASRWLNPAAALVWTALVVPSFQAETDFKHNDLRRQAEQAEKAGQWEKARDFYEQLLIKDRAQPEIRERYLRCHRLANLVQRHRDPTYREQLALRDQRAAFKLYREVLAKLRSHYLDPDKTDFTHLFQYGLDELLLALDNEVFRQERLPAPVKPEAVRAFREKLRTTWDGRVIQSQRDLEMEITKIAQAGRSALELEPVVTVLEFACGACHGLDEHTLYLTPGQLSEVYAALEGETIGIGIEVTVKDQKTIITQVYFGTPAAMAGLAPDDWITHIDRKPLADLPEEAVVERLKGAAGSLVELEVVVRGENKPRTVVLTRQVLRVPSVVQAQMLPEQPGVGYCRVVSFQKTTVQELDDVLVQFQMQGMKVLILDLRSNWGGYLPAAIQVTERFLPEGKVIVSTQSHVPEQVRVYKAGYPSALAVPLVVLVDGETASAAEVVAGALQAHRRATLVGQPTFGKWSVQRVLELKSARAGIRVTLAKFLSPGAEAYTVKGVVPDVLEERSAISMADNQLLVAIQVAIQLIDMSP